MAAALAVVAQGDKPLLLDPANDPLTKAVEADNRPPRERTGRDARESREPREASRSR